MSAMLARSEPIDQARPRRGYRSADELAIREAVDAWGRAKWPEARVVHELVMDRGKVRADMAFVSPDHLVSVEIKSALDSTDRIITQVALFRLATPEIWVVTDGRHARDVELLRYLIPSIGVAEVRRDAGREYGGPFTIAVLRDAAAFAPHPEAMLSLLWIAELHAEAVRAKLWQGKPGSHATMVKRLLRLGPAEQIAAVCRQLRGRDAFWRADPRVPPPYQALHIQPNGPTV